MRNSHSPSAHRGPVATGTVESTRLSWLLTVNEQEAHRRRLFRTPAEEEQLLLMSQPVSTQQAFALFGTLLGTFPPAAIFLKLFGGALPRPLTPSLIWLALLSMNLICCLTGRYLASKMSRKITAAEQKSWTLMFFEAIIIGLAWALGTGAAGGLPAIGVGAFFGAAFAVPVGVLAFALFIPLHRLLARGGMIDKRHLWPLALGVVMVITALILGI